MMSPVMKLDGERSREWLNLGLAVIVFVSPWVLGFAGETAAAWTAWGTAIAIAALAAAAILRFEEWEAWASIVLGLWLAISPWIVGFAAVLAARWTDVVLGLLIAAIAGWEVWFVRSHKSVTT
jgi:hypothetical protein